MRGLATLPQRWIQEPLVVRGRDRRPPRELWQCTASVCVVGVHWWHFLGVSRSRERDLSVLSIYPRIFLRVFIVYHVLVGFFVLVYSTICSCVLVVLV